MTDLEFYNERCGGTTIGDYIRAVMRIDNPEDALRFYRGNIARVQAEIEAGTWRGRGNAVEAANTDIGWCFGEGMTDLRIAMWRSVTAASHPVFGSMSPRPSAQEAYDAGLAAGAATRQRGPETP